MFRASLLSKQFKSLTFKRCYSYVNHNQYFIHPIANNKSIISFNKDSSKADIGLWTDDRLDHFKFNHNNINELLKQITEETFEENPTFIEKIQELLKSKIHNDFTYQLETLGYEGQFMPIYDLRKVAEYGRRNDTDDVFGWNFVDMEGEMMAEGYRKNEMYRVFSKRYGLPVLSEYMLNEFCGSCV